MGENKMCKIRSWIRSFTKDEKGATAVEYGIMVALIAVVIIVTVALLGASLNTIFGQVQNCIAQASTGGATTSCTN
jgi:pilus assembly protein Flp/PilA